MKKIFESIINYIRNYIRYSLDVSFMFIISLIFIITLLLFWIVSILDSIDKNYKNNNLFTIYQVTTTTAKTEKIELGTFELKSDCEIEAVKLDKRLTFLKIEGISYNANDRAEHGVILAINYVCAK